MELTLIDKKLLTCLYHNYRLPLSKMAKECKISRDQVEYRIKKFESEGLVKKYLTIFDYSLLGFKDFFIVYFRTRNIEKVRNTLEKIKNVLSFGDVVSNFDIFANILCRDKIEFDNLLSSFLAECGSEISEYKIFNMTYEEFFPLKVFGNKKEEKSYISVEQKQPIALEEKELEILKQLENNGRIKVTDIAEKIKISEELTLYKLRKLKKNGLVLGNRIQFDLTKLGFYFAVIRLKINQLDNKKKERIRNFCKSNIYANALAFGISDYNVLIQIIYQTDEELRKAVTEIKKEFYCEGDSLLLIENESTAKTLPV